MTFKISYATKYKGINLLYTIQHCLLSIVCLFTLGLSDCENNIITTVKIVVFMIVNTIMIVGYQFMILKQKSIRLSSIACGLEYRSHLAYFIKLLPVQLINIP